MAITLQQFEKIDSNLSAIFRLGDIDALVANGDQAAVQTYIRTSNRLYDACVDAMGLDWVNDWHSVEEAAAAIVTMALTSRTFVGEEA